MFAKIFSQIFDSSIANCYELRHFFMDLLVLAEIDGVVDMTPEAIAARTRIPLSRVELFLAELSKPDLRSRTHAHEGRRIIPIDPERDWGWQIVNYDMYRSIASEDQRREKTKLRTRKWRSTKDLPNGDASVTHGDACDAMQRQMQRQKKKYISTPSVDGEILQKASQIYELYPRKVGRADAIQKILKAIKSGASPERLKERTEKYREATSRWPDDQRRFIPHPATWFNQERYEDDPDSWERLKPGEIYSPPQTDAELEQELKELREKTQRWCDSLDHPT